MLKEITSMLLCSVMLFSLSGCEKTDDTYPQLAPMKNGEEVAIITTNKGVIKLRFFPQYAPLAVQNFVTHSKDGYYDGQKFHRVIKDFMIQTGDPEGTGRGGESIWGTDFGLEVSPNVRHFRGAVSMANTGMPDSNGSQFFIVQRSELPEGYAEVLQEGIDDQERVLGQDENGKDVLMKDRYPAPLLEEYIKNGGAFELDFGYTVFGQVYEGMDVVDAIAAVPVELDPNDPQSAKPLEDVIVESIKIEKYKK